MKKVPNHLVIVPDGNRRWAKERGLPVLRGHWQGYLNLKKLVQWCRERGIKILTAFGFSSENWRRSKLEVKYLMKLLEKGLSNDKDIRELNKAGVKIKIIGQKDKLPESLKKVIKRVEDLTQNNKKFCLNLAVSYGGKWDVIQAFQKIIKKRIPIKKITENLINNYLTTKGIPEPDLVIRAGGEKRLSNFLLWQTAYSEFYFSDKLWPEFSEKDLDRAIADFSQRERRFGGKKVKQYLKV